MNSVRRAFGFSKKASTTSISSVNFDNVPSSITEVPGLNSPPQLKLPGAEICKYKSQTIQEDINLDSNQLIQIALTAQEEGDLDKATYYLRLGAEKQYPLALFLFGISLRHGWGCEPNPSLAFQCLQASAHGALLDTKQLQSSDCSSAKQELIIAIYELGQCFRQGWGVSKDKSAAVFYYQIAADLGDPDAQNDVGQCYMNGDGVKKDLYKAAYYFRLADAQGFGLVGNSWIYKDKYDSIMPQTLE